ncbi:MAG: precorrin-3B C(17)-methyltransferase [Chloroflexi bacterium]|nr:precorrin-3B C(17)-methyltransferase [Chloroflexota bacterium]
MNAKLVIVGLGPGSLEHLTPAARRAIEDSEIILGYRSYVNQIAPLLGDKQVIASGMRHEMERAEQSVRLAMEGKKVAVVCSGDAGTYGMASPVLETIHKGNLNVDVEIVPGVSSPQAAASLLGAPLAHDFAVISLSDLLTPWETIARRISLAAEADFVLVLLNPASTRRTWQLQEARRLILHHRLPTTPVGIVTDAYRQAQKVSITTLTELPGQPVDMLTTVIVGNSLTFTHGDRMITPRGYKGRGGSQRSSELFQS